MVDTIKLKKPLPSGSKSEFNDVDELRSYLNSLNDVKEDKEIGVLYPLPSEDITEEIRESFEKAKQMNPNDFIDIR